MKLKDDEFLLFNKISQELVNEEPFLRMQNFKQHGSITTFDHCMSVSYFSYYLARRLRINCHEKSLIRGALLHDLYLYDWHEKDEGHRWHGFHHSKKAHDNASFHFDINEIEKNIILSHMWPLTLRSFPKKREAIIVCTMDKIISTLETFHIDCRIKQK